MPALHLVSNLSKTTSNKEGFGSTDIAILINVVHNDKEEDESYKLHSAPPPRKSHLIPKDTEETENPHTNPMKDQMYHPP